MSKRIQVGIEALVVGAILDVVMAITIVGVRPVVTAVETIEFWRYLTCFFGAQVVVVGYLLLRLRRFKPYRRSDTTVYYGHH